MALTPPLSQHDATLIAAGALTSYHRACKVVPLTTRKYEGEIQGKGSTVKVVKLSDVTITDYDMTKGVAFEKVKDENVQLVVDQAKAFAFAVEDALRVAGAGSYIAAAGERAGLQMVETIDGFVAGVWAAGAGKKVSDATAPISLKDAGAAYELVTSIRTSLADTGNGQQIAVVVPSAVYAKLLLDSRFVANSDAANATLRNGYVGEAAGVRIIEGNSIPVDSKGNYTIIARSDENAIATAMTLQKVQVIEREAHFDQAVKGLFLYGAKVIRPEAVAVATVTL